MTHYKLSFDNAENKYKKYYLQKVLINFSPRLHWHTLTFILPLHFVS